MYRMGLVRVRVKTCDAHASDLLLQLIRRSYKRNREKIRCRRKLLNITRKHQSILHTPPVTTGRRPNITRLDFTKRRRTMLTQRGLTPFMPEGILKRQRRPTPRSMGKN